MDFTPSPTYLHESEQLSKAHSEGTLTQEEYARLSEKLIEAELSKPQGAVEDFIRQELRKHEKSRIEAFKQEEMDKLSLEHERILNEKRREDARIKAEERRQTQEQKRLETEKENKAYSYRRHAEGIANEIINLKAEVKWYTKYYIILQSIIIFSSILATTGK